MVVRDPDGHVSRAAFEARTNATIDVAEAFSGWLAKLVALGMSIVVLVSGISLWTVNTRVLKPLLNIRAAMPWLSEGNMDLDLNGATERGDEIGDLAHSAEVFRKNAVGFAWYSGGQQQYLGRQCCCRGNRAGCLPGAGGLQHHGGTGG